MKKNVGSQSIGVQMVNASTGAAFTGSVTVYVTGDAGTQALGSVGSGACTHEGNGFHTYAPAQAETNYDHIAFTFIGTGAIPVTIQLYTTFPQTVDVATQVPNVLNTTASGNIGVDWANVENPTTANNLSSTTVGTAASVSALAAGSITASVIATGAIDADAISTDAVAEIADGVWDETLTAHVTADSAAVYVKDVLTDTGTTLPSSLTAIETDTQDIQTQVGTAGAGLTAVPWNAAWDAEVESEVNDAIDTAISELGVGAPTATPTLRTGLMLLYMALRNKLVVQTSGTDALEIYNDAGTKIASKLITDNGSDYTEAEMS